MNTKVTSINKNGDETHNGLDYASDIVADIEAGQWMGVMMDDEDRAAP